MHPSLGIPKILNRKFASPAICSDGASLNDKFIIKNDLQTITKPLQVNLCLLSTSIFY